METAVVGAIWGIARRFGSRALHTDSAHSAERARVPRAQAEAAPSTTSRIRLVSAPVY